MKRDRLPINRTTALIFAIMMSFCLSGVWAQEAKKDEAKKDDKAAAQDEVTGWRIKDYRPYISALEDLQKLSREYSENLLKLSVDEYATGLDMLEDMENDVNKIIITNKEKKNLSERWYWQEVDRKNQEARQIAMLKYEAKMKSITYFTRSINHLDEVQFAEVRREPKFINFQIRLFQVYVSTQYDLNNFLPCIPILERYITINDATKKDIWAYRYLASCYAFMEATMGKYRSSSEERSLYYKQKKNQNLLVATEMKYGVDSPEYKSLQESVEMDEKKSERINDFK
jgi:hypothetical protein